ncbi:hypothetical protein OV203_16005 [Nannocystis sp. ILAH1]|uniref:hypothetical protein n=1 Tax=unclassified Nannocystis TaxID=2627009 RepID=UPI002270F712|nr:MULTISPECIES: hypothetical protein [unclassified Nannocystis]MCY0988638.1 hypothetical protein [Nannocystis sp. ILAH1]MCY1067396.1 hypothetical protein [Nannocystis sp. RBIL2]
MTTRIHLFIVASTVLACTFESKLYDGDTAPTTGTTGDSPDPSQGTWDTWQGTTLETSGPGPATTTAGPGWSSDTEGPPETSTTIVSETEGPNWTTTIVSETDSHGWTTADVTTGQFPGSASDTTSQYTTSQPEEPVPCDGEAEPLDVEVLAYLESQIPANPDSDGTTGEDDDPNQLYVRFSSETFTCADPHDRISCGHQWELSVRIPAAFQAPGLYSLSWPGVHAFGLETGADLGSGDDCDGGGGSAKGTLEIVAIDADKVVGRLCHVTWNGLDNDFELDGKFIAPRCPQ